MGRWRADYDPDVLISDGPPLEEDRDSVRDVDEYGDAVPLLMEDWGLNELEYGAELRGYRGRIFN